jgi:hypothetical protein
VPALAADNFIVPTLGGHGETIAHRQAASTTSSRPSATYSQSMGKTTLPEIARHTLGLLCLSVTVVLWTASNFLASVSWMKDLLQTRVHD